MRSPESASRIGSRDGDAPFAFVAETNRTVTMGEFLADVAACAERLPSCRYAINLCMDRYQFAVSFFAAILRGQINLLPSRRDAAGIDALRQRHIDSIVLSDQRDAAADAIIDQAPGTNGVAALGEIDPIQVAAIVFTSGSTGEPQPHAKTWGLLNRFRTVHWHHLRRSLGDTPPRLGLVATVPPWHMYGLEWSLLLPTIAPATLYCGADFFPRDVAAALGRFKALPTLLVSTPTHLRALLKSGVHTPHPLATISATAPLSDNLAAQVKARMACHLIEIYGASEVGSLAVRHPLGEASTWQFFECFDVSFNADNANQLTVSMEELPQPTTLQDRFEQADEGHFVLRGRTADVVKVGGKRESLANLNAALLAIPGVEDGVVYDPEQLGLPRTGRLGALVVAPQTSAAIIRAELAEQADAAFLPRPMHLVERLPRDNTSKLTRRALREMLADLHREQQR